MTIMWQHKEVKDNKILIKSQSMFNTMIIYALCLAHVLGKRELLHTNIPSIHPT